MNRYSPFHLFVICALATSLFALGCATSVAGGGGGGGGAGSGALPDLDEPLPCIPGRQPGMGCDAEDPDRPKEPIKLPPDIQDTDPLIAADASLRFEINDLSVDADPVVLVGDTRVAYQIESCTDTLSTSCTSIVFDLPVDTAPGRVTVTLLDNSTDEILAETSIEVLETTNYSEAAQL